MEASAYPANNRTETGDLALVLFGFSETLSGILLCLHNSIQVSCSNAPASFY
jgi:hypothetical protein